MACEQMTQAPTGFSRSVPDLLETRLLRISDVKSESDNSSKATRGLHPKCCCLEEGSARRGWRDKRCSQPGQINWFDQNPSKERLDWEKPFYCTQGSLAPLVPSSCRSHSALLQSGGMLTSPPAPSRRNSAGGSPRLTGARPMTHGRGREDGHSPPLAGRLREAAAVYVNGIRPGKRFWK